MSFPFKPYCLLYGLAHPDIELSVKVFKKLGYKNVMVVTTTDNGIHFLDEFSIFGVTSIIGIRNGEIGGLKSFSARDILNLSKYNRFSIQPEKTEKENIKLAINVLLGKGKPAHEDIVAVNAGALLYLAGITSDIIESYNFAKRVIRKKYPIEKLEEFIEATGGDKKILKSYL